MSIQASPTLIESFDPDNVMNVGPRWEKWLGRLNRFFLANGLAVAADSVRMEAMLFLLAGTRVYEIHETLPVEIPSTVTVADNLFDKACHRLNAYFTPKRNRMMEQFNFANTKQGVSENIETYVTRLRVLAKYCEFADQDREIMTQVVLRCYSSKLRRELLKVTDLKMVRLLELGRIHDTLKDQVDKVEGRSTENDEEYERVDTFNSSKKKPFKKQTPYQGGKSGLGIKTERKCFKCAGQYPHDKECPAIGKKCRKCNQLGHFESCCRSKSGHSSVKVDQITEKSREDPEYVFQILQKGVNKSVKVKLRICGTDVEFKVDTGASVNVIDNETYKKLWTMPGLEKYHKDTFAYGNVLLQTCGMFSVPLKYKGTVVYSKFVVVWGDSGCLLSCETSIALKLIKVLVDDDEVICSVGSDKEKVVFDLNENTVESAGVMEEPLKKVKGKNLGNILKDEDKMAYWSKRFPTVFTEKLGKLKDYQVMLHIDESVKPVLAKPRHKPYHLRLAIEKEIKSKLESGVIEKVEDEPTEWLSETVVVPKKDSNEIRLCTDMSAANQAIKCEKYEMPNVEDIIYQSNGAEVFTKMDLNRAFEQFELHPKCRHITRFRTYSGIYQNCRLCFGVNSAPEVFHHKIRSLLEPLVGVQNATDDILIMSKTKEEDFSRFEDTLEIFKEKGLTVNPKKCVFGAELIDFFGLRLCKDGVSLNEAKTRALREFKKPDSSSELHSFLGLSVYCSRWIQDLATVAAHLWELTKKKATWEWTLDHQASFDKIKNTMIDQVAYFKLDWDTQLTVDASPVGLGAVLTQSNPLNELEKVIICFISRLLTESETGYSQIEKEALAIPWAFERLDLYLIGREFTVYTDNRAVALIYNNSLSNPPAVIRRWRLRMDSFQYKVKHRAGLGNISDFLSRHPLKERISKYEDDSVEYVNNIVSYGLPQSLKKEQILEEIGQDMKMRKLSRMIMTGNFSRGRGVDDYAQVFNELSISPEGFILKGDKIVVPENLTVQVIDLAHAGHLGMVRTK